LGGGGSGWRRANDDRGIREILVSQYARAGGPQDHGPVRNWWRKRRGKAGESDC